MVPRDNLVRANEVSTEKIILNHSDIMQKSETCDLCKKNYFWQSIPHNPRLRFLGHQIILKMQHSCNFLEQNKAECRNFYVSGVPALWDICWTPADRQCSEKQYFNSLISLNLMKHHFRPLTTPITLINKEEGSTKW